jgi:hypothetical protein
MRQNNINHLDELERQIHAMKTVSDLMLTNNEDDISLPQIAGLLNVFLDQMSNHLEVCQREQIANASMTPNHLEVVNG